MKKISLLILMLTFLLIPTCVNANGVSWEDFVGEINSTLGGEFDFEQVLTDSGQSTAFKNAFNTCYGFSVLGDYGSDSSSNIYEPTKFYFLFNTGNNNDFVKVTSSATSYSFMSQNGTTIFIYTFSTNQITKNSSNNGTNLFAYNLSRFSQFTGDNWQTETTATYFCDKCYLKPLSWNYNFKIYKGSTLFFNLPMDGMNDSDYPWEDGNAGGSGSGDTYYNYDFIGPNPQPYLKAFNTNGYMGDGSGDGIFALYTYLSDKKYPLDTLKLDLEVYEISESYQLKLVNTYKNYNGRLLNANGTYETVSSGESSVVYTYNMVNAFGADFLSQYLDDVKNYAFTIKLYDINENLLSKVDLLYFGVDNTLNYYPSLDDYYNPPYNNNGYGDINLNTDFSDLVDIFLSFMSTVMGFLSIFPLWMTTLIGMGITVAIILRIGGR